MIPLVAGAAIGAASSGVNALTQGRQNRKQRKWASKEAEKAYQRNIELWNMQNEYNAPEAQMARLKAAGLNPNLVYGKGADNTAGAISPYQQAKGEFGGISFDVPQVLPLLNQYQDYRLRKAQVDNVQEQTNLNRQKTINEGMRELGYWADSSKKSFESAYFQKYSSDIHKYQLDALREKARQMRISANISSKDEANYYLNKALPSLLGVTKGLILKR